MTPFDPVALVAMLRAFYPVATGEALARARRERPDYFSGGVLFGSGGDKLRLPDGREWDLIFAAGTADARWQALAIVIGGAAGAANPFALEDGPLRAIDPGSAPRAQFDRPFTAFVGDGIGGVHAYHRAIDAGYTIAAEGSDAGPFAAGAAGELDAAAEQHAATVATFDQADPSELLGATDGEGRAATHQAGTYDEPAPADQPVPDPGPPPVGTGSGSQHPEV